MEVDAPGSDSGDIEADIEVEDAMKNGLKRSSSAPLINQLFANEPVQTAPLKFKPASYLSASRWRRWSTSVSPVSPVGGGQSAGWARLNRLRVEETSDMSKQEIATEREVQRGITIEKNLSQSWEDLSLSDTKEPKSVLKKTCDPMVPLTIGVGPFPSPRTSPSPSPSPTRSSVTGKQCFSPSMQMPVPTNLSFSPSPSSSPTRKSWASRRSLSPITLRPSPLGPVKRKCMLDDGEGTPSKRHSSNLLITQNSHSHRLTPYKIPWGGQNWATPQPSPGPSSESGSRESSPSPFPPANTSPSPFPPANSSPAPFPPANSSPAPFPPANSSPAPFPPANSSPASFPPANTSPSTFPANTSPFPANTPTPPDSMETNSSQESSL